MSDSFAGERPVTPEFVRKIRADRAKEKKEELESILTAGSALMEDWADWAVRSEEDAERYVKQVNHFDIEKDGDFRLAFFSGESVVEKQVRYFLDKNALKVDWRKFLVEKVIEKFDLETKWAAIVRTFATNALERCEGKGPESSEIWEFVRSAYNEPEAVLDKIAPEPSPEKERVLQLINDTRKLWAWRFTISQVYLKHALARAGDE